MWLLLHPETVPGLRETRETQRARDNLRDVYGIIEAIDSLDTATVAHTTSNKN